MKRKLWAALLLVYLIIVICVNYMYINYKRITLTNYNQRLKQVTSDYSNFLQNEITTINSLIKNTGVLLLHQTDAHHDINKEIVETFKNTQNDLPLIKSIYFVGNDDGRYIDYTGVHPVETLGGADYRRRPWYTTAITSQNPVISEVYSDLITEKPVITISYALRKDDKSIGVIAADLFLEDISLVYGFITNSKDIKFIILDSKKNLILHPIKELVGSNISESNLDMLAIKSDKEKLEINKEFDELSKKLGSLGSTGNLTYKSMLGFKAYGFYQTIPNMSWYILAVANVDSLLRSYLLTLIIFTSIAGFSISLILYKWINIIYYNDTILPCFKINKLLDDISSPANKKEDAILLFIDIHSFSDISRQYGSRVSDEVLKKYVNSIKSMLSKNELLTHARSDNFILMFKNSDWENALNKSKLLFTELGNFTLKFDNFSMPISSFMALTKLNPSHLGDAEKSLYTIRKSLEATKYKYLNELLVFPNVNDAMDMQNREKAKRNLVLETIVNGKVVPFFQPIYNIRDNTLNKYEVLMRIKEGDSYLSPAPYIKIAEENDLIKQLDLVILDKALKHKKEFDKDDLIELSVNLSGKELSDFDHLKKVTNLIDSYQIKHQNIVFEITETQHVEDLGIINQWISSMKVQGFKFSIDDFGSGYASIEYLNCLSVDYVKIDGKFIKDMLTNSKSYYLVESLVKMAKAFDLKIVAEFIENKEIQEKIKEMGIDYGQGYFLGKPTNTFVNADNSN